MSFLADIQERFLAHIGNLGDEAAAKEFDVYPSIIKRWRAGTHSPPLDKISEFYEKTQGAHDMQNGAQKTVEWEGRNLMILFPCYKFTNAATAWALLATALDLGREKVRFDMEHGNSMIYVSRNILADRFMQSDCEWSLWLDDDMIPPVGRPGWFHQIGSLPPEYPKDREAMHWVHRLMGHGKSIVGATYFGRFAEGPPLFGEMGQEDAHMAARQLVNGIRPTDWVATGCLLVHRTVYEDIQKTHRWLAPGKKDMPSVDEKTGELSKTSIEFKHWQYFWPRVACGEDVSFCRRAKEAGHQVFVDTGLQALHVGFRAYHALNTSNRKKEPSLFP